MTADRTVPKRCEPMTKPDTTAPKGAPRGAPRGASENAAESPGGERIAKALARAGLCSRREAERWIAEGRVSVNGKVLTTPAVLVGPSDAVTVNGRPLPQKEPTRLWRYYKPVGLVTTQRDPEGRPTVFENLPESLPRVVSIGRLDLSSEGLLLLTNDGALARHLELPSTGWPRRYRVRVHGRPSPEALLGLKRGVTVDGVRYGQVDATLDRQTGANAWLIVTLREGKNREVRKVMESIHLTVNRLIRISFGPFHLGSLPEGAVEEVRQSVMHDQLRSYFGIEKEGRKPAVEKPVVAKPAGKKPAGRRPGGKKPVGKGNADHRRKT
jgi:23S rRNA pseudouridine2605 synthase